MNEDMALLLDRIATALERIADAVESEVFGDDEDDDDQDDLRLMLPETD